LFIACFLLFFLSFHFPLFVSFISVPTFLSSRT
jgi:hypothetical protein